MSLRERILAAQDLPRQEVEAWGEKFFLRAMTGAERERYEAVLFRSGDAARPERGLIRATLVAFCAVDAEGTAVFAEADIAALAGKSAAELMRLSGIAQELNGLTAKAAEEAAKK